MKINIIIPALEKNNYSSRGDLLKWGDSNLLEWKIHQALQIKGINKIIVSSPSKSIAKIVGKYNITFHLRRKTESIDKLHLDLSKKFNNCYLLWLNPTSPFISPELINNFLQKFKKNRKKFDSAVITKKEDEYFFYKGTPLNFNVKSKLVSRKLIRPLLRVSNGAFISNSSYTITTKNIIGKKPLLYNVDWLSSLEIKTNNEIDLFNLLIKEYFKRF